MLGESSFNEFQVIGDFVVVNVKESRILKEGSFGQYNAIKVALYILNTNGLSTLYGRNKISDYDYENNGKIYFTHFIFRNFTENHENIWTNGYAGVPIGDGFNIKIDGQMYPLSGEGFVVGSLSTALAVHEIGHSLFGSNAFHTSGGNHRGSSEHMPFFNIQCGYGIMSGGNTTLLSCNGYERWRMHWKHTNVPYYISARDSNNNTYVNSDISRENGNMSFVLSDFVTYGDAIRIKLPYKDSEDASNQYIWLENHKVGYNNKLDYLSFSDNDCRPNGTAGIYSYYQIGRDVLSGTDNEVWNTHERDNLKMIPAEGYWDFILHKDEANPYNMQCVNWGSHDYVLNRSKSNPFCGYQDMEHQMHPDDSYDELNIFHEYRMWRKRIGLDIIDSLANLGDDRDAFSTHSKINMGTNPSTCNAKTYYNSLYMSYKNFTSQIYRNNQTTYLTGLSIEMIPLPNKDFLVHVRWDDYDVANDTRWSGTISNKEKVNLLSGKTINLVQNKTIAQPYRDSISGLFSKTTVLTCEKNSVFTQQSRSSVVLSDKSRLLLKSGSEYIISEDAVLNIGPGCTLDVEECATLKIDGFLLIENGANVNIHPNAIVLIEGANGTYRIVYSGESLASLLYPYVLENNIIDGNVTINYNTSFGRNILVKPGAVLTIENATINMMPSTKIIINPGGKLVVNGGTITSGICPNSMWQGIIVKGANVSQSGMVK
jgi:hypothetical protein